MGKLTSTVLRGRQRSNALPLPDQDHRGVKARTGSMLSFKVFDNAAITIAGVELQHRIRKGQFALSPLRVQGRTAPEIWNAVLNA